MKVFTHEDYFISHFLRHLYVVQKLVCDQFQRILWPGLVFTKVVYNYFTILLCLLIMYSRFRKIINNHDNDFLILRFSVKCLFIQIFFTNSRNIFIAFKLLHKLFSLRKPYWKLSCANCNCIFTSLGLIFLLHSTCIFTSLGYYVTNLKPVYRAAVDKRKKHTKSVTECIAYRTERDN